MKFTKYLPLTTLLIIANQYGLWWQLGGLIGLLVQGLIFNTEEV